MDVLNLSTSYMTTLGDAHNKKGHRKHYMKSGIYRKV